MLIGVTGAAIWIVFGTSQLSASRDTRFLHQVANILVAYSVSHQGECPPSLDAIAGDRNQDPCGTITILRKRSDFLQYHGAGKMISYMRCDEPLIIACFREKWYTITLDGTVLAGGKPENSQRDQKSLR